MKKASIITCIVSGLGFVFSIIGLVLTLASGVPLFSEFTLATWNEHPLGMFIWIIISGSIFFSTLVPLLSKKDEHI